MQHEQLINKPLLYIHSPNRLLDLFSPLATLFIIPLSCLQHIKEKRRKKEEKSMKKTVLLILLITTLATSIRDTNTDNKSKKQNNPSGFNIPGLGFTIPGFGGGYGSGYGGPGGGYGHNGTIRPTTVCSDKGPCYKKKLTCPAKCFSSYSRKGKNYGGGGGGGGCTMDCKKKCIAYC